MTKKGLRKTIGVFFLIGAILATQIPTESSAERLSQKDEFQLDGNTLIKYTGTADTVSVPSAVNVIGEEAFADNENIVKVNLPSNLEKISYAAFSGCSKLKEIVVNDECEEIGTGAFTNCISLSKVVIGEKVSELGNGIFVGCKSLKEINSKSEDFLVLDSAIYNKDKSTLIEVLPSRNKEKFDIPATVTHIYPYAFYGCDSITKVNLPAKLQEIPAYSFSGCNGLKSISLPYSVYNIDSKAFENCSSLEDVVIPESVSFIHKTAFDGCINLNIDAPAGSYAYNWFQNFDKSNVAAVDSEDNENIDDESDSPSSNRVDQNSVSSNNIVPSTPVVEDGLSQTKVVGRHAVIFIDNTVQTVKGPSGLDSPGDSDSSDEDEDLIIEQPANSSNNSETTSLNDLIENEFKGKGLNLPKLAIVNDKIANKAFYNDKSIKGYEIPSGITSIGDFSFARSGIQSVKIGDEVEFIGYGAFYHCDDLESVDISSSVKNIEASAFDKTKWLENWYNSNSNDFLVVGDGILIAYKGSNSVVHIPDDVKVIAGEAFMDHKGITEVYLPDSLEKICEGAFKGCLNLKYVSKGSYVSQIEDRAFDSCPIETIRIVESVETLGLGAYDMTSALIDKNKKVVYFHGNEIPTISEVKTTTRLSNYNFRKNVFNNVNVAIVNSEDVSFENTVLDPSLPGFRGLICVIEEKADVFTNGTLKIIACNLSAQEAVDFSVPDEMVIYGKSYSFDTNAKNAVLEDAKAGKYESEENGNYFSIPGSDRQYEMIIKKDKDLDSDIKDAYLRIYGEEIPEKSFSYSVSMREKENGVELTKFGKRSIEISIPLPENIFAANLHLICLDEDNQLEDIPFVIKNDNNEAIIKADINHTGKYALYNANNNNSLSFNLDNSPDTGDFIHPKWFLSFGLLLASLAMFLFKSR